MSNQISATNLPHNGLFAGLEEEDRKLIAEQLTLTTFSTNSLIFSKGDIGDSLYLVLKGRVRLSVLTPEGRELSFTHATTGDTFGEIAMIDGDARTADATAIGKVEAAVLRRESFQRLLHQTPKFTQNLLQTLCERIRAADLQLEGVALHRIETRLARYLLELIEHSEDDSDKLDDDGLIPIDLKISQGELALLLGASRPKVNTALSVLEDQAAIKRDGSKILCDPEILEEIANAG